MKIVKIGAVWCPGCIVMHKVWDKIESEFPNIDITSLDIDFDEEEVASYNVGDTLPVVIFYDNDKEYKRLIGENTYETIVGVIRELNEK